MSQQLVKKGANGGMVNVNPRSWIEAIKDKNTGQTLVEILQGFNMYFLPYNGNTSSTRCLVPTMLRKKGLWITYVKYDGNVYTEWYAADELDDKSWGDSSNWRIGNNTLVGDITISANGNWVINGTETEFKAVGEKGNTPLIRVANNRLQVSYDLGDTYIDVTNNPVYTKFRWLATTGDTQSNNAGRIQASNDEGKTWTNMSNDFINNLHISRYVGLNESLPTSGIAEGTIYAKGPYYAEDDTLNDNPIYRLWVYAWKGDTLAWQDNGEFTSIVAGVVQETGDSETEVMSQKAVSEKLSELGSKVGLEEVKNCVFLYNSVVETTSNNLVSSDYFDSALIAIPEGTQQINISGVTFTYINLYNKYDFTSDNFIGRVQSGNINKDSYLGAKYGIISLRKSGNQEGYNNIEIEFLKEETPILLGKTCSIVYNKTCSIENNIFSYNSDIGNDLLVIQLKDKVKQIEIDGVSVGSVFCFSSLTPSVDSFIGSGKIIPEAKCVAYNIKKANNEGVDYSKIYVRQYLGVVEETRFDALLGSYLKIVPTSKNYIDANNLLYGYTISNGQLVASTSGVMSNKIYLENGKTYTMQGIYYYGAANRIFIGYFNAKNEYIGRGYVDATFKEGNKYGNGTFTFNNNNGLIKYIRIVLGGVSYSFDESIAQLEEGTEPTDVVPFEGYETLDFNVGNSGSGTADNTSNNHIKLLCVGNSYSQDALAYVPYIMKSICPDISISIGILYLSGARLAQHYDNFVNNNASYYYYKYNDGALSWQTVSTAYTIQEALADDEWNVVLLHQGSIASFDWSTYQPYLNRLIDLIYGNISYPVKFGWMLTQSRPKVSNTIYSDEEILEHYVSIAENSRRVMDETLCEFLIPVGTAVENARTTSLNSLGDYELGKLCSSEGGHLQEGLPSQLAAYVCVVKLLGLIGKSYNSIYGDTNRITSDWVTDKNIPGANGSPIGSDDYNCKVAQKCAIMAVKHPYEITQMVELGIVDE